MKTYRTVEVGYLQELWEIADEEVTVREHDTVAWLDEPGDAEPGWLT